MSAIRVPVVELALDGAPAPSAMLADVAAVSVEQEIAALSMFTVVLANWDPDALTVTWSDSDRLAIGTTVRITMGYLDEALPVMVGDVTGWEPTFAADRPPTLTVRGYDHGHLLTRGRRTRAFTGKTDSAIASEVARDAGLDAAVEDTGVPLDYVVQTNQTDLEFLRRRADLIGYEVFVRDEVLHFRRPQFRADPVATLHVGADLVEFTPRLGSLTQVGELVVRGWDVTAKEAVVGRPGSAAPMGGTASGPALADRVFTASKAATVDTPVQSRAEADRRAEGRFADMALDYVQGEAECIGRPDLRAGTVVDIQGAGRTFSGPYYLTSVTHELTVDDGYRTHLGLRRNAA